MNKIEKSIIDGLNGVTSRTCNWKLFSSRTVNPTMELKSDKEKKVYDALCEFLKDNDTSISVLPTTKFFSMFVDWSNDKLLENVSVLVDIKTLEKCLKMYWNEFHLSLNRYFCIAMNSNDDKLYIVSVCRESNIYKYKEVKNSDGDENSDGENSDIEKIAKHLADVSRLAKEFSIADKIDIVHQLEKLLEVNATVQITKASKQA